jgi:hypothetical protein
MRLYRSTMFILEIGYEDVPHRLWYRPIGTGVAGTTPLGIVMISRQLLTLGIEIPVDHFQGSSDHMSGHMKRSQL